MNYPTVGSRLAASDANRHDAETPEQHPLAGLLRLTVEAVVTHPDGTTD